LSPLRSPAPQYGERAQGAWSSRFAPLAREFQRQLEQAPGTGGALCVFHHGAEVLHTFGGTRNAAGAPWREDTPVMAFSTGKGCAVTLMHTLIDEGLADYDDLVTDHWPEFAAAGKGQTRLHHVLTHRAGLHRLGDMISDFWQVLDFNAMVTRLERATPAHAPGEYSAYHGISFSWLLGELLRRIGRKPLDALMRERLVEPLGLDHAYFGLPETMFDTCAELTAAEEAMTLGHYALSVAGPIARVLSLGRVRLDDLRAALVIPAAEPFSWNDPRLRRAWLLSTTGVFSARALARIYGVLAQGGSLDGVRLLSPRLMDSLQKVRSYEQDRVMGIAPQWRLGYHGIQVGGSFVPGAFGHCGYRGTGAFADPARKLAFAFVHNAKDGVHAMGGARFQRLSRVAIACADG
jgi:CubicO group peptidase (beta-lactamase class C family)